MVSLGDAIFQQYVRIVGPGGQQGAEGIRRQIPVTRLSADLSDHVKRAGGKSAGGKAQRQCLPAGIRRLGQAAGLMVMLGDCEKMGEHGRLPGSGRLVFICEQRGNRMPAPTHYH